LIYNIKSYAKLNLFLHVMGKRDDGYHELLSLMTPIDLCDDLEIDFSADRIIVDCDHPGVPTDESNLVFKAARAFFDHFDRVDKSQTHKGIGVKINKQIPPGGGLGGGSSDAATVFMALNHYYDTPFTKTELMELGLKIGAVVPFFIFGSPALVSGIGEKVETSADLLPYHVILCSPGIESSTASVFKTYDFRLTIIQKYNINTGLNVGFRGRIFDVRECLHNDLEESAFKLYPQIKAVKEEMELLLKRKVYMTGSGSSLFTLFSKYGNAKAAFAKLNDKWEESCKTVFLSSF
jgi:4-diphosphocytidyl-2-C-methyl-D-erythritol kinase